MRVVLDTNVLLSAFLWQKGLKPIYQAIHLGKITPCFIQITWTEFLRALFYKKFKKQLLRIAIAPEELIKLLASRSDFVRSSLEVIEIKEDLTNNYFLACALSCGASFIVSGDKHLLKLKDFQGISILSSKEFIKK